MRLNFEVVIVDDDWNDRDKKEEIEDLIRYIERMVVEKGFEPEVKPYASIKDALNALSPNERKRVNLYLSDNNLGDGSNQGIDFYLDLKSDFICDFILYTRSDVQEIVDKLSEKLQHQRDPNLFSRFTFFQRAGNDDWHIGVGEVINHILSKREELNNLRGLYAQQMSKVENHLKALLNCQDDTQLNLDKIIDMAFERKIVEIKLKRFLHSQRKIRNGVIHNDEYFCEKKQQWYIEHETLKGTKNTIYEDDFSDIRKKLKKVVGQVLEL